MPYLLMGTHATSNELYKTKTPLASIVDVSEIITHSSPEEILVRFNVPNWRANEIRTFFRGEEFHQGLAKFSIASALGLSYQSAVEYFERFNHAGYVGANIDSIRLLRRNVDFPWVGEIPVENARLNIKYGNSVNLKAFPALFRVYPFDFTRPMEGTSVDADPQIFSMQLQPEHFKEVLLESKASPNAGEHVLDSFGYIRFYVDRSERVITISEIQNDWYDALSRKHQGKYEDWAKQILFAFVTYLHDSCTEMDWEIRLVTPEIVKARWGLPPKSSSNNIVFGELKDFDPPHDSLLNRIYEDLPNSIGFKRIFFEEPNNFNETTISGQKIAYKEVWSCKLSDLDSLYKASQLSIFRPGILTGKEVVEQYEKEYTREDSLFIRPSSYLFRAYPIPRSLVDTDGTFEVKFAESIIAVPTVPYDLGAIIMRDSIDNLKAVRRLLLRTQDQHQAITSRLSLHYAPLRYQSSESEFARIFELGSGASIVVHQTSPVALRFTSGENFIGSVIYHGSGSTFSLCELTNKETASRSHEFRNKLISTSEARRMFYYTATAINLLSKIAPPASPRTNPKIAPPLFAAELSYLPFQRLDGSTEWIHSQTIAFRRNQDGLGDDNVLGVFGTIAATDITFADIIDFICDPAPVAAGTINDFVRHLFELNSISIPESSNEKIILEGEDKLIYLGLLLHRNREAGVQLYKQVSTRLISTAALLHGQGAQLGGAFYRGYGDANGGSFMPGNISIIGELLGVSACSTFDSILLASNLKRTAHYWKHRFQPLQIEDVNQLRMTLDWLSILCHSPLTLSRVKVGSEPITKNISVKTPNGEIPTDDLRRLIQKTMRILSKTVNELPSYAVLHSILREVIPLKLITGQVEDEELNRIILNSVGMLTSEIARWNKLDQLSRCSTMLRRDEDRRLYEEYFKIGESHRIL